MFFLHLGVADIHFIFYFHCFFFLLFKKVTSFQSDLCDFYIPCIYHIRLPWQCYENIQSHKTLMNHSSQVSEIKDKTSNLKVTLMSVYLLRLYITNGDVHLQMYLYTVHVGILVRLMHDLYFRGFLLPHQAPLLKISRFNRICIFSHSSLYVKKTSTERSSLLLCFPVFRHCQLCCTILYRCLQKLLL